MVVTRTTARAVLGRVWDYIATFRAFRCSYNTVSKAKRMLAGPTYRLMGCLIIHMDEGPLDVRENLDFILELLANIMCFPQRCICVHYDVNLDEVVWSTLEGVIN